MQSHPPSLRQFQIDAFASRVFQGNPAAIVPLDAWLPDQLMQQIAMENNLAETAYIVNETDGWRIRWFTPALEIDLCGHATLAAAWLMWHELGITGDRIDFQSRSGLLSVTRSGDLLELDFPSRPPQRTTVHERLIDGLGTAPLEVLAARDYLVVYRDQDEVLGLKPDMSVLKQVDRMVIATAPGKDVDFVSRFFAPQSGVDEDPVTGSAHCTLIPYWAGRLNKTRLSARQVSARTGEVSCELRGDRVGIAGRCVLFSRGEIYLP